MLGLLLAASPAVAFQVEVERYYQSMNDICRTGVTPEISAAYARALQAVEQARQGGGRNSDFWGLKTPEGFLLDCFQGDGRS